MTAQAEKRITKYPSRVLNEKPGFLGLSVFDFAVLGYFLILTHTVLTHFTLELLAFPLSGLVTVFLINVRLKNRPKVIRDYFFFITNRHIYPKLRLL